MLESNGQQVAAAQESEGEARQSPRAQFHLGARALADFDYPGACEHLRRTVGVPGMRRIDLAACLYALCMAGRKEEADLVLAGVWDETRMKAIPPAYWFWMQSTFDLKIPWAPGRSP
jgi:hypothetical protein